MNLTTLLHLVRAIRSELKDDNTDWQFVYQVCELAKLDDTAFREMLADKDKKELLKDYLLSREHHKNHERSSVIN